jgi:4-amino-4-deoxy-L-arabinose transferase-like glycosyltransferase
MSMWSRDGTFAVAIGLALAALTAVSWALQSSSADPATLQRIVLGTAGISTLLVYCLARLLRGRLQDGLAAAALFASMPLVVHAVQHSQLFLLPVPFILGWLIAIECDRSAPGGLWMAGAGAALGLGLLSHEAALVMMPALLGLTLAVAVSLNGGDRRGVALVVGFAIAALPALLFLTLHPAWLTDHIRQRGLYDTQRFSLLQGMREMTSWVGLTARSESYWDYLDPALLFLSRRNIRDAFSHPDVFLVPFAVCLPFGLYRTATVAPTLTGWLMLGAFVLAPLAPAMLAGRPVAGHLLLMAPTAAVIATRGLWDLVAAAPFWPRALGYLTLIATVVNTAWFLATATR